jgi:hypothetical protein
VPANEGLPKPTEPTMTTLRPDTLALRATGRTFSIPDREPVSIGTQFHKRSDVGVTLAVDDAMLRKQLDGFDGMERPFVMLPSEQDGKVTWWRHELKFARTGDHVDFMRIRQMDHYQLPEVKNVDAEAVRKYGVAVGLETNVGTVWAQEPGKNAKVQWF